MEEREIEKRKLEHVEISLSKNVEASISAGFDEVFLVHNSLPEIDFDEIETAVNFFGKKLSAPLIISGMTGGYEKASEINAKLAKAAEELNIALGVGSQRAAIIDKKLAKSYSIVRKYAKNAFIIANIGAVQLKELGDGEIRSLIDMVEADAIAVHLNPLQEIVQEEGDRDFKGCIAAIDMLKDYSLPVIVKETGAGISREVAKKIEKAKASAIDISGLGGTSFAGVEYYRKTSDKELAELLWNWGIRTCASVAEVSNSVNIPVIASGGIRSGIDGAKAIALGASYFGLALPFLKAAVRRNAKQTGKRIIKELRVAMLLTGAKSIDELKKVNVVVTGKIREWLELRNIDCRKFANRKV